MICKNCGSENFKVVETKRRQRWSDAKDCWIIDDNADTRRLLCNECSEEYYATSFMQYVIKYDHVTMKLKRLPIDKFIPRFERKEPDTIRMF
jgi:hypothetical protein